ncbi:sodium/pantothenate symporter [Cloacibacillus porcorum]|uniref:sodium/pantothenate symporter n=1 Tax=Cloacibacillus porcorum TaxID=1197717 RepID=UPI002356C116|nr:sodium/pantothenate symporter [Cloacibacillus porcorum]MCI5866293.1 sodium/pantothenate symporter [Cloacibacillus porcorum]MDD7648320.1 sodium/pantothenate symporter [Cloacibacillus porcorum]MDY4092321.1 sodium/pantothenate symporter [Cloacibacillus porcorum]
MVDHMGMIVPLILYFILIMGIALWGSRAAGKRSDTKGFMEEYFIGSRSMGGFVLAMAIITTYTSASSFVGGPGVAYNVGLGWILLSMIQVPTAFLTLGVLGKRFALIARRTNAVTITDFIRARYGSDLVVILASLSLLVFFMASMLAQFIGGARLFESVTGYSYQTGLLIFGLTVVIYTTVGGFRAVVLTDTIQGVMMLFASLAILYAVITAGGGVESIMQTLYSIDPQLLTPTGGGNAIPKPFILSFWVLVGIGILGLPQTTQKCLGYKDSRSMHNAMIIGTFVVGFTMLAMHLVGAMGRAVIPDITVGDLAVPTLTVRLMSPFWAGIFIAGPLAAIMSTVDSMLIMCSAAIVKDLYFHYIVKNDESRLSPKKVRGMSLVVTAVVGVLVFFAAMKPPSLLVWINLFAFGGLEAVFFCPTLFGLYWKRANSTGAILSMICGAAAFFWFNITKTSIAGTTAIVPTLVIAIAAFVAGSLLGRPESEEKLKVFEI